jgi:peptidoglycan/xylan/chitin deacetylase (PgdA/CDA1 family)
VSASAAAASGRAVVLMYHRLGPSLLPGSTAHDVYAVTPESFDVHLEIATRAGHPVAFEAIAAAALEGRALPPRAVAFTFDDGCASDHAIALPALARRGLRAAFFITPAWIGTAGHLTWTEVKALQRAGMTIGAHGLDHALLSHVPQAEVVRQLREARRIMAAQLGQPPTVLALPGGAGSPAVLAAARAEGFAIVMGSVPRVMAPRRTEDEVPRFAVRHTDSAYAVHRLVAQKADALLPAWLRYRVLKGLRATVGEGAFARIRDAWTRRGATA